MAWVSWCSSFDYTSSVYKVLSVGGQPQHTEAVNHLLGQTLPQLPVTRWQLCLLHFPCMFFALLVTDLFTQFLYFICDASCSTSALHHVYAHAVQSVNCSLHLSDLKLEYLRSLLSINHLSVPLCLGKFT